MKNRNQDYLDNKCRKFKIVKDENGKVFHLDPSGIIFSEENTPFEKPYSPVTHFGSSTKPLTEGRTKTSIKFASEKPSLIAFRKLSIGTRFKYINKDCDTWVVIEPWGDGLIAKWTHQTETYQSICSFVDENYNLDSLVEVVD